MLEEGSHFEKRLVELRVGIQKQKNNILYSKVKSKNLTTKQQKKFHQQLFFLNKFNILIFKFKILNQNKFLQIDNFQQLAVQNNYQYQNTILLQQMLKGKISYLKARTNQRIKTLESFCKYEKGRFNQATHHQNNQLNKKYCTSQSFNTNSKSWTDIRVQQIKKKYDIPKNKILKQHQRNYSSIQNIANNTNTNDFSSLRKPLRQRSFSNFQGLSRTDVEKNKQNNLQSRIQIIQETRNSKIRQPSLIDAEKQQLFNDLNYNETFNKSSFNKNSLSNEKLILPDLQYQHKNLGQFKKNKKSKDLMVVDINSRIENIEKINFKIKVALENLSQKNIDNCQLDSKNIFLFHNKVSPNQQSNPLQQTKIFQKTDFNFQNNKLNSQVGDLQFKNRIDGLFQNSQNNLNETNVIQANNLQHSMLKLNISGKIESIQKKISYLENEKKKLNINFQPFNFRSKSRQRSQYKPQHKSQHKAEYKSRHQRSNTLTPEKINKLNQIRDKYANKISCRSTITEGIEQNKTKRATVRKNSTPFRQSFDLINIKQNKSQFYGDEIQQQHAKKCDQIFQNKNFDSLIKLTKSGIQMRKQRKKLSPQKVIRKDKQAINQQLRKLLIKQIKVDENLRKAKFWFSYLKDQNKWQTLQLMLKGKQEFSNQFKNVDEILCQFELIEEQVDPFFSIRVNVYTYQELINLYIESQQHWKQICRSGIFKRLLNSDWIQKIDMDGKGYGNLQDLVRFINFNSDYFYKNRDLLLIFQRMTFYNNENRSSPIQKNLSEKTLTRHRYQRKITVKTLNNLV